MDAVHAFAGDVVVHDDHIAVKLAGPVPDSVHVVPSADRVMAHDAFLGEFGQILDGNVRVLGVNHIMAHRGVHVENDVNAPAVLRPGREIRIVDGGRSPEERAVARLALEWLIFLLHAVIHNLDDFAVNFVEILVMAVDQRPLHQFVERFADSAERRIRSGKDIPFFHFDPVLLIHELCLFKERIPVILDAVDLFNFRYCLFELIRRILMAVFGVVLHGEDKWIGLNIGSRKAAALEHGCGFAGVAGLVGGELQLAENGEGIVNCDAGLRGAPGADIGRQAVRFRHIDIVWFNELVDIADDEFRKRLHGLAVKRRETSHKQRWDCLIQSDDMVGFRAAAQPLIVFQNEADFISQSVDNGVAMDTGNFKLRAAVALKQAVHKGEGSQE